MNSRSYQYLRQTLGMTISNTEINCRTHPIIDGKSLKQGNSYDCGVFALANVESYLMQTNFPPVSQSLMKVFRCRYLNRIYNLARDLNIFDRDLQGQNKIILRTAVHCKLALLPFNFHSNCHTIWDLGVKLTLGTIFHGLMMEL